jgi:hypothetical protein
MSITKKFNYLVKDIKESTQTICTRPTSPRIENAKIEIANSGIDNFTNLSLTEEYMHLRDSINQLQTAGKEKLPRSHAVATLKQDLINLSSSKSETLLDNFTSLCRRHFLLREMDRMLNQIQHHPKITIIDADIAGVYDCLGTDDDVLKRLSPNLAKSNSNEYLFEIATRHYWVKIMTALAEHSLQEQLHHWTALEKISLSTNPNDISLSSKLENLFEVALRHVENVLKVHLSELYKRDLFAGMRDATLLMVKEEFIHLGAGIQQLQKIAAQNAELKIKSQNSRNLAIAKILHDYQHLLRYKNAALLENFNDLYARFLLFEKTDKMFAQLHAHPRMIARGDKENPMQFGFTMTYFCLSRDDDFVSTVENNEIITDSLDVVVRKYWLDIMADFILILFEDNLRLWSDRNKIHLYRSWNESAGKLFLFKESIVQAQIVLDLELNDGETNALLGKLIEDKNKSVIHKKLYVLEDTIRTLSSNVSKKWHPLDGPKKVIGSEFVSRAGALDKLQSFLVELYDSASNLDAVYSEYSKHYDEFMKLENTLVDFMDVFRHICSSTRPIQPLESAISQAYYAYATGGQTTAVLQVLWDQIKQVRQLTYNDHVMNGALRSLGFFQPPSRMVVAIDRSLEHVDLQGKLRI